MKTYKIHLIRHGLTDGNLNGQYIGSRTDLPLSASGVKELGLLRDSVEYPEIQALYSSPMLRCKQTAAVLYPDMPVIENEFLKEYDFGDFEGKTADMLESNPAFREWASGKIPCPPNGETTEEFVKRVCLGFNKIVLDMMEKGITNSAVIMHGGAIMMLLSATAVPRRQTVEWTSDSGRGYSVMVTPSLYHSSGIIEVYDII